MPTTFGGEPILERSP
ncbi:hypothetical protein [Staphylococcus aureus]